MSKFWKIALPVIVFFAAMILLTFLVPDIKTFASGFAASKDLPLWIVGLFAPILYLFIKIKDGLLQFTGESETEKEIRKVNEQIKQEISQLRQDVGVMDRWMRENVGEELRHIERLNERMAGLQQRRDRIEARIAEIEGASAQDFLANMTDEEIENEFQKRLAEKGLVEGEPIELVD